MRIFMRTFLVMALCLTLSVPALAAGSNTFSDSSPSAPLATGNPVVEVLTFYAPYEVYQIRSTTTGSFLTVSVEDCCVVGDMWVQRTYCLHNGSVWDVRGKGNGVTSYFSGATQVFKKGTQPIDCITEVRYGEGVSMFPAGMYIQFATGAADTVTTTVLTAPVPLVSQ